MNNILFLIRAKTYTISICLLLLASIACKKELTKTQATSTNKRIESLYTKELDICINYLDSLSASKNIKNNIDFYKKAREHFKTIEPILAFTDQNNYKSLNAPNFLQIQEEDPTDIKIRTPFGFQVIEELLFTPKTDPLKIHEIVSITNSRLKLIRKNTRINFKNHHIIWLIRNQIVRIATTGITGFDSPVLGQSLLECQYTYKTLINLLDIFQDQFKSKRVYTNLKKAFQTSINHLNHDFDSFDRYAFIKTNTDAQLKLLVEVQKDWNVNFPFEMALSNTMTSLFSPDALNLNYFTDFKSDTINLKQKEFLGNKLFNDKMLSKNNDLACVSCHIKDKAFTDGKALFDNRQTRNSPTLPYSAYQQLYFMDARSGSLEGQIVGVANNHNEFNLPMDSIANRIKNNPEYNKLLDSLYNNARFEFNIRHAIASYVRSLNPFNSKFDNNINDKKSSLSVKEKTGFNLFMGKAACATCHFPPLFNGTVPPNFNTTELEIIGVPETKENKMLDDDLGRYYLFNTKARKGAFKTPTIRNIEKTAPYMHNGTYTTLEEVIDFYNDGGGVGLGFDLPHQTLPFDNLDLSEEEQTSIIAFMKTLTDEVYTNTK
ncbi:cytochrome-c peroxidase [Thalassobellus suaedae]|uniref:Cytochrome c peroxidase n=1 Tax=Thalassobellus suaedae TaxID=3074124 RepID=A0ABY9XWE8_9FLAO|nr:cytochrome c peroxidase [Flavobacteriaceae bacterium HL-DH14]